MPRQEFDALLGRSRRSPSPTPPITWVVPNGDGAAREGAPDAAGAARGGAPRRGDLRGRLKLQQPTPAQRTRDFFFAPSAVTPQKAPVRKRRISKVEGSAARALLLSVGGQELSVAEAACAAFGVYFKVAAAAAAADPVNAHAKQTEAKDLERALEAAGMFDLLPAQLRQQLQRGNAKEIADAVCCFSMVDPNEQWQDESDSDVSSSAQSSDSSSSCPFDGSSTSSERMNRDPMVLLTRQRQKKPSMRRRGSARQQQSGAPGDRRGSDSDSDGSDSPQQTGKHRGAGKKKRKQKEKRAQKGGKRSRRPKPGNDLERGAVQLGMVIGKWARRITRVAAGDQDAAEDAEDAGAATRPDGQLTAEGAAPEGKRVRRRVDVMRQLAQVMSAPEYAAEVAEFKQQRAEAREELQSPLRTDSGGFASDGGDARRATAASGIHSLPASAVPSTHSLYPSPGYPQCRQSMASSAAFGLHDENPSFVVTGRGVCTPSTLGMSPCSPGLRPPPGWFSTGIPSPSPPKMESPPSPFPKSLSPRSPGRAAEWAETESARAVRPMGLLPSSPMQQAVRQAPPSGDLGLRERTTPQPEPRQRLRTPAHVQQKVAAERREAIPCRRLVQPVRRVLELHPSYTVVDASDWGFSGNSQPSRPLRVESPSTAGSGGGARGALWRVARCIVGDGLPLADDALCLGRIDNLGRPFSPRPGRREGEVTRFSPPSAACPPLLTPRPPERREQPAAPLFFLPGIDIATGSASAATRSAPPPSRPLAPAHGRPPSTRRPGFGTPATSQQEGLPPCGDRFPVFRTKAPGSDDELGSQQSGAVLRHGKIGPAASQQPAVRQVVTPRRAVPPRSPSVKLARLVPAGEVEGAAAAAHRATDAPRPPPPAPRRLSGAAPRLGTRADLPLCRVLPLASPRAGFQADFVPPIRIPDYSEKGLAEAKKRPKNAGLERGLAKIPPHFVRPQLRRSLRDGLLKLLI
eukprot:TRINITY_DN65361_c0_g1_i1.p1 TRINITY_DN65361_c0_g1~~TRINITY_DN65361_c0_g1_i1.p1  ORF type:complete len:972 (+),score=183.35 TRINITY_DN65361_c0_g1_i1:62-2977(+)